MSFHNKSFPMWRVSGEKLGAGWVARLPSLLPSASFHMLMVAIVWARKPGIPHHNGETETEDE